MTEYIIIQAGGKGTRLGQLTHNKPKGIVPVNNLPIIFHLFRQYPDRKFIIIGDYKHEVLEEYLESFCEVDYLTVKAEGKGTIAGIQDALKFVPKGKRFMIVWSDLILAASLDIDKDEYPNYIGISRDFECRWSFHNGKCIEERSKNRGIAGLFIFENREVLKNLPKEGELVRWFSEHEEIQFKELSLLETKEIGTILAYDSNHIKAFTCRPFNSMEIDGNIIIKRPVDSQGEKLAIDERAWYREVTKYGFEQIPQIYEFEPLKMQKINGVNIYKARLSLTEKKKVIDNLVDSLNFLHGFRHEVPNQYSNMEAYYTKTVNRLGKIRDLVPHADKKIININGKQFKNPYFYKKELRQAVAKMLLTDDDFVLIHGDCTFSNTMIDKDFNVIFLDPRGYFGKTKMVGDAAYDWAKVYYSIYGDYDRFNNKEFSLDITEDNVVLNIETNGWKDVADYFLGKFNSTMQYKIRFIHAIIWLSLTTYAWEDYDSICGAFYNGTMLMDEFLLSNN